MSATHESTARDYEREAEETRHRLADTLNELHDRLTPGDILNELLSYSRSGGGAFVRAASTAARQNPIPAMLIGTGCAMFMAEKTGLLQRLAARAGGNGGARRAAVPSGQGQYSADQSFGAAGGSAREAVRDQASSLAEGVRASAASAGEVVSDAASTVGDRVSGTAASVGNRVSGAAASVSDAASSAAQQLRHGVRETADRLSDTASQVTEGARQMGDRVSGAANEIAQGARDVGAAAKEFSTAVGEQIADTAETARQQATRTARQAKEKAQSLVEEQPLLVAGIGIAIGAALAAILPPTKAEDEFMGEASDSVKDTLAEVAAEQYQKAKDVAGTVAERAKSVAEEEGLTAGSAADVVRSVGDKVKRVVTEAASSAGSQVGETSNKDQQA
jgi:ElaB/YqjD/DUF883 family membrane-anchored ribosome-binding protein